MTAGPARIRIAQRVEWLDTDAAGIYHWTTVARFGEAAEAALHNALGIAGETFGHTPRLSVTFSFHTPLRFNDEASVEIAVASVGRTSVRYRLRVSTPDGTEVADGEIVCCLVGRDAAHATPWPAHIRRALEEGRDLTP